MFLTRGGRARHASFRRRRGQKGGSNPLNEAVTLTYDAAGQPATLTNALSKTWNFTWQSGALTSATDPLGRTVNQVVDAAGRVTGVTGALGHTTLFDYDAAGRRTSVSLPNGITMAYT